MLPRLNPRLVRFGHRLAPGGSRTRATRVWRVYGVTCSRGTGMDLSRPLLFGVPESPAEMVSQHDHGQWRVAILQVKQGHRWVITEIHVTPIADVPIGGLTARDFDLIRPVSLAWLARRGEGPPLRGTRPQEPKWANEELEFLQRYAALVAAGERAPAKVLSEEYAITERAVHNRLSRLRNKGMLTRPGPGAAGGVITAKGKAAIKRAARGAQG